MMSLIRNDVAKLRRTFVGLLMAGIPLVVFVMTVAVLLEGPNVPSWPMMTLQGLAIWAYFLLPMSATALTALMALVEHGSRGWAHVLALPIAKWKVFASKAVLATVLMLVLTCLVVAATVTGGLVVSAMVPSRAPTETLDIAQALSVGGRMWLAGLLVLAIQFAIAMRFESFAVPVLVGISGTFVALVATSARQGLYFPWLMPTNVLASDPGRADLAVSIGAVSGLVLFAVSCLWLARRDWD